MITDAQIEGWLAHRPMSRQQQTAWRRKYCRRQLSILWTERRIIVPELVPVIWGDGQQVIAVRPINTRREHYIVAIDSGIRVESGDVHEIIDNVKEIIEELFGMCQCVECGGEEIPNDPRGWKDLARTFKQWPTPCFNGGCEWWCVP